MNDPRGSIWRKWDLHIHTPLSIINNYINSENVWEDYILDLGALPQEFKVLGINDYLFLDGYEKLMTKETKLKADIKKALAELEIEVINQYPKLSIIEIKTIVVDKKWMHSIETKIKTEMDAISHRLTERIKELAERYETPMPKLTNDVTDLAGEVEEHLKKMGYSF